MLNIWGFDLGESLMWGCQAEPAKEVRIYRAYKIGSDGRFKSAQVVQARDDAQAIRLSKSLAENCAIELWERTRFLRRIEPKTSAA